MATQKSDARNAITAMLRSENVPQPVKDYLLEALRTFIPEDATVLALMNTVLDNTKTVQERQDAADSLIDIVRS